MPWTVCRCLIACGNRAAQGLSGPLSSLDNLLDGHMMSLLSLDLSANRFAGQPRLGVSLSRPLIGCLRMLQSPSSVGPQRSLSLLLCVVNGWHVTHLAAAPRT